MRRMKVYGIAHCLHAADDAAVVPRQYSFSEGCVPRSRLYRVRSDQWCLVVYYELACACSSMSSSHTKDLREGVSIPWT